MSPFALFCSQAVNVLVFRCIKYHFKIHVYILFSHQTNNIPDPNIIIFEMTKDDRKDFYRTIGKQIE